MKITRKLDHGAIRYIDENGCLHRNDGPAWISTRNGYVEWYQHGQVCNPSNPTKCSIWTNGKVTGKIGSTYDLDYRENS